MKFHINGLPRRSSTLFTFIKMSGFAFSYAVTVFVLRKASNEDWARKDLNLGPMDYESTALPLSYEPNIPIIIEKSQQLSIDLLHPTIKSAVNGKRKRLLAHTLKPNTFAIDIWHKTRFNHKKAQNWRTQYGSKKGGFTG